MNTNAIHNVLNVGISTFAGMAGFDFTALGLSTPTNAKIAAAMALAKLFMNAYRDGLAGMVKEQPPVR